ncbi:MAG: protein kinase, partial [Proteobacteria bacterium]|nr:protein kinase [Pseudomonadota bacterium]
ILLDATALPRLTDFGIARLVDSHRRITQTGASMGTIGYMAPEHQSCATTANERSDLYSVGATLYALMTGEQPFELHHLDVRSELFSGLPAPVAEVVCRATTLTPENRYSSSTEMRLALEAVLEELAPDPLDTPALIGELAPSFTLESGPTLDSGVTWGEPSIEADTTSRKAPSFKNSRWRLFLLVVPLFVVIAAVFGGLWSMSGETAGGKHGGTLHWGLTLDRGDFQLYPMAHTTAGLSMGLVAEGLVRQGGDGMLVGGPVERVDVLDDGSTLLLGLRSGVQFHPHRCLGDSSAREVKPQDLVYSLQVALDDGLPLAIKPGGIRIQSRSVRLSLKKPTPFSTAILARVKLIPADLDGCVDPQNNPEPVGTGPYRYVSVSDRPVLRFERNDAYWQRADDGAPLPRFDVIEMSWLSDPIDGLSRLGNGQLNVLSVNSRDVDGLLDGVNTDKLTFKEKYSHLDLDIIPEVPQNVFLFHGLFFLPSENRPQLSLAVRRAIATTLDMDDIRAVVNAKIVPSNSIYRPGMLGFSPIDHISPHRSDEAARILHEAGFDGREGHSTLRVGTPPLTGPVAQTIQRQLSALEVPVEIVEMDWNTGNDVMQDRLVDAVIIGWGAEFTGDEPYPFIFELVRYFGEHDPQLVADLEAVSSEMQRQEREILYRRIQSRLLNTALIVPFGYVESGRPFGYFFADPNVQGMADPVSSRLVHNWATLACFNEL